MTATARKVPRGAIHADRKRGGGPAEAAAVGRPARHHRDDGEEEEEGKGEEEAGADFLAELRDRFAPSDDELASEEDLALAEDGTLFGGEEAERVTAPGGGGESDLELDGGGGAAIGAAVGEGLTTESLDAGRYDDAVVVVAEEGGGEGEEVCATVETSRKAVESEAVLTPPAVGEEEGTEKEEGTGVTLSVLLLEDIKTMKVQHSRRGRCARVRLEWTNGRGIFSV